MESGTGGLEHDDPDVALALDQLADGRAGMEHIARKYAAVTQAYEAMDAGWPSDADVVAGRFGYVAMSITGFLDLMFDLEQALAQDPDYRAEGGHLPVSLLDAGCGTGRNLHLIENSGAFHRIDARGIDIVEAYVEHGRATYGLGGRISLGDCMNFDYGGFDVVYFYRPFSYDSAQEAFERHLVESVPPGTYIAAPLTVALDRSHRLDERGASGQIWKKLR